MDYINKLKNTKNCHNCNSKIRINVIRGSFYYCATCTLKVNAEPESIISISINFEGNNMLISKSYVTISNKEKNYWQVGRWKKYKFIELYGDLEIKTLVKVLIKYIDNNIFI